MQLKSVFQIKIEGLLPELKSNQMYIKFDMFSIVDHPWVESLNQLIN